MTGKKVFKIMIKTILLAAFFVLLLLYTIPMSIGIRNIGNILGAAACIAAMAVTVFYNKFKLLLSALDKSFVGAVAVRFTAVMLAAALLYTASSFIAMAAAAHKKPENSSTLILLGCKVNGTSPSLMLKKRILAAYDYLENSEDTVCVLSGGKGSNEGISEAQCMFNELTARGIDKNRLFIEDKSTSTYENLKFSYNLIEEKNLDNNIAVVTDGFHQLRAKLIADKLGINVTGAVSAETPWFLFPTYLTREVIAVLAQLLGLS